VEGDLAGGAGGVVQHHAGDGEAVPLQEARLGDLLCSPHKVISSTCSADSKAAHPSPRAVRAPSSMTLCHLIKNDIRSFSFLGCALMIIYSVKRNIMNKKTINWHSFATSLRI